MVGQGREESYRKIFSLLHVINNTHNYPLKAGHIPESHDCSWRGDRVSIFPTEDKF